MTPRGELALGIAVAVVALGVMVGVQFGSAPQPDAKPPECRAPVQLSVVTGAMARVALAAYERTVVLKSDADLLRRLARCLPSETKD